MKVAPLPGTLSTRMLPPIRPSRAPTDGQPQPGAAVLARGGAIGLREVLEDPLLRVGRDAGAGVLHADLHDGRRCRPPRAA